MRSNGSRYVNSPRLAIGLHKVFPSYQVLQITFYIITNVGMAQATQVAFPVNPFLCYAEF